MPPIFFAIFVGFKKALLKCDFLSDFPTLCTSLEEKMTFGRGCQSIQFLVFQGRCNNIDWCVLYWCRHFICFSSLLKGILFFLYVSGWKTSSAGGSSSMSKSNLSLHSLSNASHGCSSPKVVNVFQSADVFLLCYRISDPASLFSAINFWCPEIRCYAPTTPIILVGCQSDLRLGFHYFWQMHISILKSRIFVQN